MAASETEEHRAPRRQWSLAEKRRIVELTLVAGASTRSIAIEQGVHPTSLSHWKSLYRAGKLDAQPTARVRPRVPSTTFMPVSMLQPYALRSGQRRAMTRMHAAASCS
jgi:transposase-like protein